MANSGVLMGFKEVHFRGPLLTYHKGRYDTILGRAGNRELFCALEPELTGLPHPIPNLILCRYPGALAYVDFPFLRCHLYAQMAVARGSKNLVGHLSPAVMSFEDGA